MKKCIAKWQTLDDTKKEGYTLLLIMIDFALLGYIIIRFVPMPYSAWITIAFTFVSFIAWLITIIETA